MVDNRRRQYYVDRLFQRRFMMVFLLVVLLMAAGNLLYYFQVLKPAVEDLMYRSHIPIENPVTLILQHVSVFSVGMVLSVLVLVVGMYTLMRIRLQHFMNWLLNNIRKMQLDSADPVSPCPGEEFENLLPVLNRFFEHVSDQRLGRSIYVSALVHCVKGGTPADVDELLRLKWERTPDPD